MNSKHKRTLEAIFEKPTPANIHWDDIEKLFKNLGATIKEGSGSRLAVELHGVRAYFHRPHPEKETDKGALASVRRFLENAGVTPC
ncbi:MAG: type II toxin-antitoxin system HicA family toxin [Verrucomicrobia bacterium]|nr:type II toxin-antitoxin system HicA family toxin [Verrucomicrobiota bacterium]